MERCSQSYTYILKILYKYICGLTLITHFTASPKTFLFLRIKFSNAIWSYVHSSSVGLKIFSLLLKIRSPENFAETECHHTKHLSSKPQWPLLTEATITYRRTIHNHGICSYLGHGHFNTKFKGKVCKFSSLWSDYSCFVHSRWYEVLCPKDYMPRVKWIKIPIITLYVYITSLNICTPQTLSLVISSHNLKNKNKSHLHSRFCTT